jgi:hypothetical protein
MLDLLNPFSNDLDADVALNKSTLYLYALVLVFASFYIDYVKKVDDNLKIVMLCAIGFYILAILIYIYNAIDRGLSQMRRDQGEIEQLKKKIKELSQGS